MGKQIDAPYRRMEMNKDHHRRARTHGEHDRAALAANGPQTRQHERGNADAAKEGHEDKADLARTAVIDVANENREEHHEDAHEEDALEEHHQQHGANALVLPDGSKTFFHVTERGAFRARARRWRCRCKPRRGINGEGEKNALQDKERRGPHIFGGTAKKITADLSEKL